MQKAETEKRPAEPKLPAAKAAPRDAAKPQESPKTDAISQVNAQIDEERKKRGEILGNIRPSRNKLAYKINEKAAISRLSVISKKSTKDIGFLRRRKEQIEFRIATEAFTLDAEKDLIRKKGEIEKELEESIKSYRLRRKLEFIDKDIEELTKRIDAYEQQLKDSEKRLDVYYDHLRKLLGDKRRERQRGERQQQPRKEQKTVEISLADIAVIKDKKNNKEDTEIGD
ncbi:MAG: hypothetical protein KGI00_02470 [Candidatus Micrarchaeota archaeon]|nr:hypothetical protein [Candidatus Micrarchaeota archaeon]MDE1823776.1 hypothetical protein [Candidatus Micrarchaeota archaeon]MDE1849573.1 hypothetical protein [Candidatus Micrarchaeota archaeon]